MIRRLSPLLVMVALLAAACGGATPASPPASATASSTAPSPPAGKSSPKASPSTTPAAQPAPAKRLTKVDLRFDWVIGGQHLGFVEAVDRGYYKQAGLDVTLLEGKGSGITMNTVSTGADTFGIVDATTAAIGISKGVPIVMLADILQQSPNAVFWHRASPVRQPADLKGHVLIASAGDAFSHVLPAVLKKGGLTKNDVKLEIVQPSAKYAAFLHNPNAVMSGFSTNDLPNLRKKEPTVGYTTLAAWGYNTLAAGLVTRTAEVRAHPNVVRAFMSASAKGWAYAVAHPSQAVADAVKMFPDGHADTLTPAFKLTVESLHTPASKGKPWGWMAKSDWQQTLRLAEQFDGLKNPKPVSDYYTNAYIAQ